MKTLNRSDQSVIGRWWWTIDRLTILATLALIGFGIVLVLAATPAVAIKHGLENSYFVDRHIIMLVPALLIMFGISLLSTRQLLAFAIFALLVFIPLLAATPFFGTEIKGATRWLQFPGFSIQPSEFVKPLFAVMAGFLFSRQCENKKMNPALIANLSLFAVVVLCLVSQPDIGMTFLISATWFGQFFLAGLSLVMVGVLFVLGIVGLGAAYYALPHFSSRFDRFLTNSGDNYQTDRALDAFMNGGLFGAGPGSGTVKMTIPDAHSDFIFAVAGEELGLIWCIVIVALFALIVLRGFWRIRHENNLFVMLAAGGLLIEFGLQTVINLASTLRLMPAKGMTLPFISYGGSSLWAMALEIGMLLALTRKRYGLESI